MRALRIITPSLSLVLLMAGLSVLLWSKSLDGERATAAAGIGALTLLCAAAIDFRDGDRGIVNLAVLAVCSTLVLVSAGRLLGIG